MVGIELSIDVPLNNDVTVIFFPMVLPSRAEFGSRKRAAPRFTPAKFLVTTSITTGVKK